MKITKSLDKKENTTVEKFLKSWGINPKKWVVYGDSSIGYDVVGGYAKREVSFMAFLPTSNK